jgi:hypothetical protein
MAKVFRLTVKPVDPKDQGLLTFVTLIENGLWQSDL